MPINSGYDYQQARALSDSLPFRRVVAVRPKNPGRRDIFVIETLECGHEWPATKTKPAKRRRCWLCGPVSHQ